jgi:alkylhydroperoxidase/carboxymuconolactone decarboxylase family protein YurZ
VTWRAGLTDVDPDFLELADLFTGHPWRHGVLEPKVRAFVLLAVDAAATHRNPAGVREDIELALRHGATPAEIVEVLELTSTLGIHACNCGVPILLEELEAAGQGVDLDAPLTARQEEIKAEFTAKRGYWNDFWNGLLHLDAEFFATYTAFSANAWERGTLEPKVRELVYTAFDASATHMFEPGLRQHIRNAIGYGATKEEIMEVFELASGAGLGAFALGAPALRAALAER